MNNQQAPGTGKRMALAIVLSLGLMIGLQYFAGSGKKENPQNTSKSTQTAKSGEIKNNADAKTANTSTTAPTKAQNKKYEATNTAEKIIKKETENYVMEFSSKGGVLKKILLKKFFYEGGKLIDITPAIKNSNAPLFLTISSLNLSIDYNVEENDKGQIIFFQEKDGVRVEKVFTLSQKDYHISLDVEVKNQTDKSFRGQLDLSWGTSIGPFVEEKYQTSYDKKLITSYYDRKEQDEEDVTGETVQKSADIDWIGLDNRYFFVAIIPQNSGVYSFKLQNEDKVYDEKITLIETVNLEAKTSYSKSYTVYIGPKDERILKPYNRNLEAVTERTWFAPIILIGKGIKWILFQLDSFIKNFGWTIVLFSLLLKFLLNPLTAKSMDSAKKMQALQPQIAVIKERYKKNPQEMNAKIWALYKQEKVSPASGCLPLLLQMPFFFALYEVLPYIVELKNVQFLWINDLSSPDTVMFIDIFKDIPLLPYRLNILPMLLTVFSFIQTKTQGNAGATGQGKMMEMMMPLMFLFIFWNMPSGLVLYWLMQTVFTIVHQYIKNKQPNKKKEKSKKSVKLSHKK